MKRAALVLAVMLAACHGGPTIVEQPVEIVKVTEYIPVPGEVQVIEIPVSSVDAELVRLLLSGLGEIGALECVPTHAHTHREEVCGIVSETLRKAKALP